MCSSRLQLQLEVPGEKTRFAAKDAAATKASVLAFWKKTECMYLPETLEVLDPDYRGTRLISGAALPRRPISFGGSQMNAALTCSLRRHKSAGVIS